MADDPVTWVNNATDLLKYVAVPFGSIGGWAGVRWLLERYGKRGSLAEQERKREADTRDKTMASMDSRQAALMDRVERSESKAIAELDHAKEIARREIATLQLERDVVWFVILEQEQDMVVRREAHIMTIGNYNGLVQLFERLASNEISVESVAEIRGRSPEGEPPRLLDLRIKVREKTLEMKAKLPP